MTGFELKISPDKEMIDIALQATKTYSEKFIQDEKALNRLCLAVEEAIANVLRFSLSDTIEHIKIKGITEGGELKISVLDKGIPGNYEDLKEDDSLGLTIMRKSVDQVNLYNYGSGGRCQELVKHIYKMPDFAPEDQKDNHKEQESFEPKEVRIIPSKKEDMLMVTRGIYQEYGFTYPKETAYYPDKLWEEIQSGHMYSTVAVDEENRTLGHFSIWEWGALPGIWESGMAVVNKQARGAGVFSKLYPYMHNYAQENLNCGFHIGEAITTHPYSQKGAYKFGSRAVGFLFNMTDGNSMQTDFKGKVGEHTRDSYIYTGICFDKNMKDVYAVPEVKPIIESRYAVQDIKRNIITDDLPIEGDECENRMILSPAFGLAQTYYYTLGKDFADRLDAELVNARKNAMATIELNIIMDKPGVSEAYEIAKERGFFFAGSIPGSAKGDVLLMDKMITTPVDYDKMHVLPEYQEFLDSIRAFDPDQQKK